MTYIVGAFVGAILAAIIVFMPSIEMIRGML